MDDEGEQGEPRTCAASRVLQDYMSLDVFFVLAHDSSLSLGGQDTVIIRCSNFQKLNLIMVRFDGSQHLHYCPVGGT